MKKKDLWQIIKFMLFSISAGLIQVGSFSLLEEVFGWSYWPAYLTSLTLSVLWNFTFNRRYTFQSAVNVPLAMAKVAAFYVVFTPLSTWLGSLAEKNGINDYIVLAVTMISNFVLEFLFCKLVVYRGQENTLQPKKKEKGDFLASLKKMFAPMDMTKGVPWKGILWFTLPMIIGNIAQQLYNTVDSIVVGKYVGDEALAAVGSAAPLLNMLLVLFIGISAGVNVMVAQYVGSRDRESLSHTVGTAITVTGISCLFLMAVATPLIRPVLEMLNTPATPIETINSTIIDECTAYLMISVLGGVGMAFYNILSGILRGLGDSFSALLYLLVATVLNIGLDILFVVEFKMGVAGVALATVIAQIVSSILCMVKLMRMRSRFDFGFRYLRPKAKFVKTIVKLGLPAGLTQAIFSSAMIVVQSLTNLFGATFIAANVVVMRVDGFAMMPNFSFGTALTTYAGQNVGAGKYDRVTKGAKQGTLMAVGCSAAITGIILLFGKELMGIFTDTAALVDKSYYMMCILAVGYVAMAVTQSLSGIMRGAGDTTTPMWISLMTTVLIRVPLAYGISYLTRTELLPYGREECIMISLVVSWVLGAVLTAIFYRLGRWKNKAIR